MASTPSLTVSNLTSLFPSSCPTEQLVDALSKLEPTACLLFTTESVDPTNLPLLRLYYSGYLFALLLVDDLNEARFLTHRFPPPLSDTDPILVRTKDVLRAVWTRRYPTVYRKLRSPEWPVELRPLAERYSEHFRKSTFQLLSRAYTSIPPKLVGMYLGLGDVGSGDEMEDAVNGVEPDDEEKEEMVRVLTGKGWRWDAAQQVFIPDAHLSTSSRTMKGRNENEKESITRLVGLIGGLR